MEVCGIIKRKRGNFPMKKITSNIACFIGGIIIASTVGAIAANYTATPNEFPVKVNGQETQIEGYNIEGSTYFKLRDIGDKMGFAVDFQDNTIIVGYNVANQSFSKVSSVAKGYINIYQDGQGKQYVELQEVDNVCGKTGLFYCMMPKKDGTWEFEEYNKDAGKFETIGSGTLLIDANNKKYYITLDDYNTKIAPSLDSLINKYL